MLDHRMCGAARVWKLWLLKTIPLEQRDNYYFPSSHDPAKVPIVVYQAETTEKHVTYIHHPTTLKLVVDVLLFALLTKKK